MVETHRVTKAYQLGGETVHALRDIDFMVRSGEYVSIMGPSGSGKSTLFNMIGGLDHPTSGEVFLDEIDIAQLDSNELAWLRCRKIGYIFQTFNLIPVMTALDNVTLPMIFAGVDSDESMDRGVDLLDRVGLKDRLHHRPNELSGGQQQRVAIARALANRPAILLADEPTGNLDLKTGREIIDLLQTLNRENGVTIITATHDLKMIEASDRVVHLSDGRIEREEMKEGTTN
ncbi:MAG: ABC transporter ATP-binding protein [Candidatus Omnitrophica bacterium]|nr:ABC transporter ATP-binding protein [Candidatus Omnitrophota bacterium]MCA9426624.1 ABC transporter ATP-binding protein [Candidatus Omnitrophota bacterium]MCA9435967.1 ABC transporter ATP-binding protein [Candidatus Omnitrophota bacterium]MCA9439825.1 ABC transporter ATP-binding protein [Candidatus Omnitrophota bacterium]MCB9782474.1 ABC transporter ATP-binding protein [Candidatus Omnitrophota bacterium]